MMVDRNCYVRTGKPGVCIDEKQAQEGFYELPDKGTGDINEPMAQGTAIDKLMKWRLDAREMT